MDLAVPYVGMFYATQFAESITFDGKYSSFDFSMTHLGLLKKAQTKMLKPISGSFYNE